MLVQDIYNFIDELAPFSYAMSFDNSGLLLGDRQNPVKKILVTLDCTFPAVEKAIEEGADLIVAHHPVIFDPIKNVLAGSVVHKALTAGISVICAHTNLDLARGGVNDCLAKALGLGCLEGLSPIPCRRGGEEVTEYLGRISFLKEAMTPDDFAAYVKEKLSASVRYAAGSRPVQRVAVCGGSGADCLEDAIAAGADALVTSEVKHHIFLQAQQAGITLVDAGHFHTEDVVIEPLAERLRWQFPEIPVIPYHLDAVKAL